MELAGEVVALLVLVAFVAGTVDAVAGGGGLLVVPALLLAGLPPVAALATNKVQAAWGSGGATLAYARAGRVRPLAQWWPALLAALGAGVGALLAARLPVAALEAAIPAVLVGVALYFGLQPRLSDQDRAPRLSQRAFDLAVPPAVGLYDGLLGPGAGSFYMLGFVGLRGHGLLKATAHTKLLNFASNLGSLLVFALVAEPLWLLGLLMGLAQLLGAQVGARLALRVGARVIRPLIVAVSLLLALRLLLF